MPVPAEVRKVKRPVNTVIVDNGREGPNRYAVRQRSGIKYVAGGNPQPHNGKVIGHIIDGKYVPVKEKPAFPGPDMRSYGSSALVKSVSDDIVEDLLAVYPAKDAYELISAASLRVIKPHVSLSRLAAQYTRTFIGIYYPGAFLSANTVYNLIEKVGEDQKKRLEFYQKRFARITETDHIAIDGMLKQDSSEINDPSKFSYKGRIKGTKDISVLYAYDTEKIAPICAEVFPGNRIDAASYREFIVHNNIRIGIMIDDKGFPPGTIRAELKDRPDLHYLTPIHRNDKRIGTHNMLAFEGAFRGVNDQILCKKVKINENTYLYAFKNVTAASREEKSFALQAEMKNRFDKDKFAKKSQTFGVIVFESDLDMKPEEAYQCYTRRWLLELVFDRYKNDEALDHTNVQSDYSVYGIEFLNFLSTLITCRVLNKATEAGVLEGTTYGEMIDDLSECWRLADSPETPSEDDGCWIHTLPKDHRLMEALGLSKGMPKPEPKKLGRPRKNPEQQPAVKKKRGRPRKHPAGEEKPQ